MQVATTNFSLIVHLYTVEFETPITYTLTILNRKFNDSICKNCISIKNARRSCNLRLYPFNADQIKAKFVIYRIFSATNLFFSNWHLFCVIAVDLNRKRRLNDDRI